MRMDIVEAVRYIPEISNLPLYAYSRSVDMYGIIFQNISFMTL
jgi:hypothetical protein